MEALGSTGSVIAVVQIAGSIAKLCGGYISDVKDARRDIERLQAKTIILHDVLEKLAKANDSRNPNSPSLSSNVSVSVEQCSQDLRDLQKKLQSKTRHKTMSKIGVRALKWPVSKAAVNEELRMLEGYLPIFNTALELSHLTISQGIDRKVDKSQDDQLLSTISYIGDAAYESYENQRHRQCLDDTRVDLLREITGWATSKSHQYIFWLKGRAGTGKSTVALTIAQTLDKQGVPLASFFFKRGGGDLARSRKVISTLAYQLAVRSRPLGSFICEALRENPSLGNSASVSQQYEKLLLRPFQKAQESTTQSTSFIVVLDALDECDDFNDVRLLLRLLGDTKNMADLGLRVLVTSRPEVPIRLGFSNMRHIAYQELALHDVPRAIVDQDIKTFVAHELAQIKTERNLPNSWPGDDKIRTITTRADGLFIYAATVCRYVNGPRQVPASVRLKQICQESRAKHKSTQALDEMYLLVLKSSMEDDFATDEAQEVLMRMRQILGSLVLLLDNLSAEELGRLLLPTRTNRGIVVQNSLDSLHAIFDIPEDLSKPIQMLHLSFRDFLVDDARCPDARFWINQQQMHHHLSIRCLNLMMDHLVQNICQLPDSGTLVIEVSETSLSQHLPFGLRYACRHWIDHAELGHLNLENDGLVHNFLQQYCPYWLEVMSLCGKIPEAITVMNKLERLIQAMKAPKLHFLVQDILRLMLTFNSMLTKAPLQLYSAGLVFSPSRSVFRRLLPSWRSVNIEVITQLTGDWNACIQTLEGHSGPITSVVFSPDGSRVVSGSGDNTVRVWDVQTGQCEHTLDGHSDRVHSVVFSPDGSRVASGSRDKTVRVWDVQTGQCEHTLDGHSDRVYSVVFSPDGSRVASGSGDNTVRVWDIATSSEILCYDSGNFSQEIKFSQNSKTISVDGNLLCIPVQTSSLSITADTPESGEYLSVSELAIENEWITLSSERILWLPPEYRPFQWAGYRDTIVIGSGTGRVTFVHHDRTCLSSSS